ncbi:LPS export ABC transporter periplasmic protein LptC [Martelella alba]|uniref:LPS export ABC transporter periplasmic protein LptC n=1 Tax=Martelella alba TaxID=2590451 RepID=A0A506U131_9HYPH|nr:LPS export ABC transporter periplasmic protein LptC [Martelella alba]TPW28073.1 LPS export ABC transporter periplasmic protein LptC [Martelella alba]
MTDASYGHTDTGAEQFRKNLARQNARNYRIATRHSRRVRYLKFLLPLLALVISLGLVGFTVIRAMVPEQLSLDSATVENGMIVMTNPGISGRNSNGIQYTLNAERALQPIDNQNKVILEKIKAAVPIDSTTTARVTAQSAIYDRLNDRLNINDPFTLRLSNGLTADFNSAFIDIKAGELKSDTPVSITASQATLVAQNVNITDNGRSIDFGGGVHVVLNPTALTTAEQ